MSDTRQRRAWSAIVLHAKQQQKQYVHVNTPADSVLSLTCGADWHSCKIAQLAHAVAELGFDGSGCLHRDLQQCSRCSYVVWYHVAQVRGEPPVLQCVTAQLATRQAAAITGT